MSDTLTHGRVTALALRFDKLGRPYVDARVELLWVDDLDALMRQSSRPVQVTFTTEEEAKQIPLFEAP